MTRARESRGFTLLEVLVAIFIMSLVITFAFQAYQGIATAFTRVTEVSSRDRAARILLDRIERELAGAVMVQREEGADPLLHPYLFYLQPRTYEDTAGFELRFVTQTPLRSPGGPTAALALVTYATIASETGAGLTLLRQEEPLPTQLVKQVEWTAPQSVADNIGFFNMRFSGEGAGGEGEGWDSTGVSNLDDLPTSVELAISLWEFGADGEPTPGEEFTRVVNLLVRPFRLAPDGGADAQADCGDGVTVAACFEKFSAEIGTASPSLAAAISDARSQVQDACWNGPEQSPALERLKVLLSGLAGFDAGACP